MHPLPAIERPWAPRTRLRHYKGGLYEVVDYCLIEATLETGVLYRPLTGSGTASDVLWMRPLARFADPVDTPQGTRARFCVEADGP